MTANDRSVLHWRLVNLLEYLGDMAGGLTQAPTLALVTDARQKVRELQQILDALAQESRA